QRFLIGFAVSADSAASTRLALTSSDRSAQWQSSSAPCIAYSRFRLGRKPARLTFMNASIGPTRRRSSSVRTPTWRSQAADFGPTLRILALLAMRSPVVRAASTVTAIGAARCDGALCLDGFHEERAETLHAGAVVLVEARRQRAVDVPDADQRLAVVQRHDDL